MTNKEIKEKFVKDLTKRLQWRIETFEESYAQAKVKVKNDTCAGVVVWAELDQIFAGK